jgi:5-formyltetrahydrofolate cyclo-ligase
LPTTDLVKNNWGIFEPEFCRVVHPQKIEVIFIPLLISDKKGNRVGYGKGFYDKLLSKCSPEIIKIGLNFFEPIQEIMGVAPTDIPLDFLVTPHNIYSY